jgi:hypothetical protein
MASVASWSFHHQECERSYCANETTMMIVMMMMMTMMNSCRDNEVLPQESRYADEIRKCHLIGYYARVGVMMGYPCVNDLQQ